MVLDEIPKERNVYKRAFFLLLITFYFLHNNMAFDIREYHKCLKWIFIFRYKSYKIDFVLFFYEHRELRMVYSILGEMEKNIGFPSFVIKYEITKLSRVMIM